MCAAYASSGTQQVGYLFPNAYLWDSATNTAVNLSPSSFSPSYAFDTNGSQQVGVGYQSPFVSHALLWSGTAESFVDLHPEGFTSSQASSISGSQKAGYGVSAADGSIHALLWNDTTPIAVDLGYGKVTDTDGARQVGNSGDYACLWSGTATSKVNLHPAEFTSTVANGISGDYQVGAGTSPTLTNGSQHALLWNNTAESYVDLNPDGYDSSYASGIYGSLQVGYGSGTATGGNSHALLWNGSKDGAVDLHQLLPAGFNRSYSCGIDANGNVVGYASDALGKNHAILWQVVPEPSSFVLLGMGIVGAMGFVWRKR
jgi:hypothetical protein